MYDFVRPTKTTGSFLKMFVRVLFILPCLSAMYQTRGVDISLNANTQHKMPSSGEVVQPVGVEKTWKTGQKMG